jgi:gamma-glutamyltranspeptidase/glutathione hydrolase
MLYRPAIEGTRYMVSSTHYLATMGGMRILEQGGNAADAGVAAGLCINVVQPKSAQFGGVAPIIFCPAAGERVETVSGLGRWPKAASIDYFMQHADGDMPLGILRWVTPAAPDGWLTALDRYGTMTFEQVVQPALDLVVSREPIYEGQKDLAITFRRLIEAEQRAGGDRHAGLKAARDLVYKGEMGQEIAAFSEKAGGFLRMEDLAGFNVRIEPPEHTNYHGYGFYSCGPWCQGPTLLMALNLLEGFDLEGMGHNSADYLHTVLEALKLTFSDRHHYFGDPDFVQVPMQGLLSKDYAIERRKAMKLARFLGCPSDMCNRGSSEATLPYIRYCWGICPVGKKGVGQTATF